MWQKNKNQVWGGIFVIFFRKEEEDSNKIFLFIYLFIILAIFHTQNVCLQHVLQVPNVFPDMFQITPHFVPYI